MVKSLKILLMSMAVITTLMICILTVHAEDTAIVQDSNFTLYNEAVISADAAASDGYCAKMLNDSTQWDIQYDQWNFSNLKSGASYDVYFKVKVKYAKANPTGNAFGMGVYDATYGSHVLSFVSVPASNTQDMVWKEYKVGTFKPNSGVNRLIFYVAQTNNASQISEIYVDCLIFKEHTNYTIQDSSFNLYGDAVRVPDGNTYDNSVARMPNGQREWCIQAPIDGSKIEAGAVYDIQIHVKPERADYYTSSGDVFSCCLYDITNNTYPITPVTYNTNNDSEVMNKFEYCWSITLDTSVQLDPSHSYVIAFIQTDNAANFPAFRVDKVVLSKQTTDDNPVQLITANPYKISPANADGLNDTTDITYTLTSSIQSMSIKVYDSSNNLIRTILNNTPRSPGKYTASWDGKNNSGIVVANGLYSVRINDGTSDIFRKNIQVLTGVVLTAAPSNTAKDFVPKGVWFEGHNIPKNPTDSAVYCDFCFSDIRNAGANTVFIANFNEIDSSVYTTVLDKADLYDLKIIAFPYLFSFVENDILCNDEVALYNMLNEQIAPVKNHNAFYAYLLYDEPPCGNAGFVDKLKDMKRILETLDPNHISVVDFNTLQNAEEYYSELKTQSVTSDPYGAKEGQPIGDFTHLGGYGSYPGFSYESMLEFMTLQARKDIVNEAPAWNILQAYCWPGWLREPTAEEIRAMTYLAIGRGTKGFTYFMYQACFTWDGMVDGNYNHKPVYTTIQTLFSEIESMETTIKSMKQIANVAVTIGGDGGSGAYASADVTTHEDPRNGNKYLVVVNHDCEAAQNVTIIIDRAKLGMHINEIRIVFDDAEISYSTTSDSYIISNLNFAAGAGKILKLVRNTSAFDYTGQDISFTMYNDATNNNADISASDSKTAVKILQPSNGWDIQWQWDKTQFTPGVMYDLYAVIKIKYADDIYYDSGYNPYFFNPSGNAFSVGVYNTTTGGYDIIPFSVSASSLENMFWHTIKVGSFIPSQTDNQLVYLFPTNNNTNNVSAIYVDKFYFMDSIQD